MQLVQKVFKRRLTRCVPPVVAGDPGQNAAEGGKHVEGGIGDDHCVVDVHLERHCHQGPPDTCGQHRSGPLSDIGLYAYCRGGSTPVHMHQFT